MAVDREAFDDALSKMYDNFRIQIRNQKFHEFLWQELKCWSQREFLVVCQRIMRNDLFFPKLKNFLDYKRMLAAESAWRSTAKSSWAIHCDHCDGNGYVFYKGMMHRAKCEHGRSKSVHVPVLPDEVTKEKAFREWFDENWGGLKNGLRTLHNFGIVLPREVEEGILERIREREEPDSIPF